MLNKDMNTFYSFYGTLKDVQLLLSDGVTYSAPSLIGWEAAQDVLTVSICDLRFEGGIYVASPYIISKHMYISITPTNSVPILTGGGNVLNGTQGKYL